MRRRPFEDRFCDSFVPEPTTGCWLWIRHCNHQGYGTIHRDDGRNAAAHRIAYELFVGPIPAGLQLDHLCRTRCCVNPSHLEAVTARENVLRSNNQAAHRARQTHCIHGHPFDKDNTYFSKTTGCRQCRTCGREWWRRNVQAQRAAA